jgi:hypothetical protein
MKITFNLIKLLIFEITVGALIVLTNLSKACPEDRVTWTLILLVTFICVNVVYIMKLDSQKQYYA